MGSSQSKTTDATIKTLSMYIILKHIIDEINESVLNKTEREDLVKLQKQLSQLLHNAYNKTDKTDETKKIIKEKTLQLVEDGLKRLEQSLNVSRKETETKKVKFKQSIRKK
jgi:hypothetical protein